MNIYTADPLASCLWWLTNLINHRFSLLTSHIGLPYFITIFSLVPVISLTTFIPHISFHLLRILLNLPSYTPHIEEDISLNISHSLTLNMNSRPGNKKVTETYLNISRRIVKLWNVTYGNTSSNHGHNKTTVVFQALQGETRKARRHKMYRNIYI
jgi:hypothetical protein